MNGPPSDLRGLAGGRFSPYQMGTNGVNPTSLASSGTRDVRDGTLGRNKVGRGGGNMRFGGPPGILDDLTGARSDVTNTMGYLTNYSIPYARVLRAMIEKETMGYNQLYHIIVCKKEKRDPAMRRRGTSKARVYSMLNIPAWNYYQAKYQPMPQTPEEVVSAETFWSSNWYIGGIVRTEEGEDIDGSTPSGQERIFNLTIMGTTQTFNVWGPHVRNTTRLFLIVKKVAVDGRYVTRPMGADVQDLPMDDNERGDRTNLPFQLVFYAHPDHEYPPDDVLYYEDEFGNLWRGKVIFLGTPEFPLATFGSTPQAGAHQVKRAPFDLGVIMNQPTFSICLDIRDM
jgi:hypothetical protein